MLNFLKRYDFSIDNNFSTSRMKRPTDILVELIKLVDEFVLPGVP